MSAGDGAAPACWALLVRHGATRGNLRRAYVGRGTDEPLSGQGMAQASQASAALAKLLAGRGMAAPSRVYVSPMLRARQTASAMLPTASQVVVDDLAEMDFGAFEGRTADEMADDARYRSWVEGMCEGACPEGESRASFCERSCRAFLDVLHEARDERPGEGARVVPLFVHGGTIMAVMERFGRPARDYYAWHVPNCGGYLARVRWDGEVPELVDPVELGARVEDPS